MEQESRTADHQQPNLGASSSHLCGAIGRVIEMVLINWRTVGEPRAELDVIVRTRVRLRGDLN